MTRSRLEQETIILFNEEENSATIQVYNGRLRRRLEQLHSERPGEVSRDYNGDYIIPKGWIKINPGQILSAEARDKLSKSMKQMRQAQLESQRAERETHTD